MDKQDELVTNPASAQSHSTDGLGDAAIYGATLPEKLGDFKALAQGKCDYVVDVIHTNTERYGHMMTICASDEAVYVTKAQAMAFFGLIEAFPNV